MRREVSIGALCGLAWACGLRGFMTQVTTGRSTITWTGTFIWILAPGIVIGALLGLAEHIRRTSNDPRGRWLVWSPFVFSLVLPVSLIMNGSTFEGGVGGAALGVPALSVAGAYALAGRRPWVRMACGLIAMSAVPIWAITAPGFGGPQLSIFEPKGAWVAIYFWSFLAMLMIGTAIPLKISPTHPNESVSTAAIHRGLRPTVRR